MVNELLLNNIFFEEVLLNNNYLRESKIESYFNYISIEFGLPESYLPQVKTEDFEKKKKYYKMIVCITFKIQPFFNS